ncbi:hypothetical protein GYMLUDRAFT_174307 [Collybiopsis luxurians FD-317 M1]|uniref:RING-type domain-containing protein n=1 Tax=Collybiopsis luxurians FD-317 M1 TaxID=944289 RepID=A0A0D0BN91_9AGAR|nr:hypothetical protein GYMLUDRAFT_174307 [Collybiopsis luxurians FD-317 M1]
MHPHGHCQICLSYFVISEFQVLPCGHGACNSCFEQAFTRGNNKGRCFVCRTEFSPKSGHRIHLQLVDSKVAVLTNTVEGLEKMDADVKLISVRRASERIRKTADEIDCAEERVNFFGFYALKHEYSCIDGRRLLFKRLSMTFDYESCQLLQSLRPKPRSWRNCGKNFCVLKEKQKRSMSCVRSRGRRIGSLVSFVRNSKNQRGTERRRSLWRKNVLPRS